MRNRDPLCDNDVNFFLAKDKRETDIANAVKCKSLNQACGKYKPYKQEGVSASLIKNACSGSYTKPPHRRYPRSHLGRLDLYGNHPEKSI